MLFETLEIPTSMLLHGYLFDNSFGGGFGGVPPMRGPSAGGGMHVGFDHPMFRRGGRPPGSGGIHSGPEILPRQVISVHNDNLLVI